MVDLGLWPVELDDQQRLDVERVAGVDEFLGRMDRRLVHHLHAAWNNARPDDLADARAGILGRGETDEHGAGGLWLAQNPHRHLSDDAEQAFRAGDDAEEIIPPSV